jgi:regulator of replication initiation timing
MQMVLRMQSHQVSWLWYQVLTTHAGILHLGSRYSAHALLCVGSSADVRDLPKGREAAPPAADTGGGGRPLTMAELLEEGARLRAEQERRRREAAEAEAAAASGRHKKVRACLHANITAMPGLYKEKPIAGWHICAAQAKKEKKEKKKKDKDKKAKKVRGGATCKTKQVRWWCMTSAVVSLMYCTLCAAQERHKEGRAGSSSSSGESSDEEGRGRGRGAYPSAGGGGAGSFGPPKPGGFGPPRPPGPPSSAR